MGASRPWDLLKQVVHKTLPTRQTNQAAQPYSFIIEAQFLAPFVKTQTEKIEFTGKQVAQYNTVHVGSTYIISKLVQVICFFSISNFGKSGNSLVKWEVGDTSEVKHIVLMTKDEEREETNAINYLIAGRSNSCVVSQGFRTVAG